MIIIHFEGDASPKYFEIMYEGFMIGGSVERNKGLNTLRREIKILDKLEAISEPFDCGKMLPVNEEPCRRLKGEQREISFEKPELELLIKYMSIVPWTTGKSVRNALEVIDWLESTLRSESIQ